VGSLTGEVASKNVTEAYKGQLTLNGNQGMKCKRVEAGLTVRLTSRTDAKAGVSDPRIPRGRERA